MTKKKKLLLKILYYFFISLVSLALAGVCLGIIFYASGYQINWQARKIEKTGMLVINSDEKSLKVLIDGKEVRVDQSLGSSIFNSAYKISLLPGKYDLEIDKDGRKPYTQNIEIQPELVVKIDKPLLFPAEIPEEKLLEKNIDQYLFSPDNTKVIYKDSNQKVFIYDLAKKQEQEFIQKTFNSKTSFLSWDKNGQRVLLKTDDGAAPQNYYLLDTRNPENSFAFSDKLSFLPLFDQLYFSPTNGDEFFGLEKNDLYQVNPKQNSTQKIAENIAHLVWDKDFFYYSDQNNLIKLDPTYLNKETVVENFALDDDFTLRNVNGDNYIISGKSLYLIIDKNNLSLIDKDVVNIIAEANNKNFFYTKEFEIWSFDTGRKSSSILTRFSKEIKNIQEFFNNTYLLYQQGTDIDLIKKDGIFTQSINNNITDVRVLNKNTILLIEKNNETTVWRMISLEMS